MQVELLVKPPLLKEQPLTPGRRVPPEQVNGRFLHQLGTGGKGGDQEHRQAHPPGDERSGPGKGQGDGSNAQLGRKDIQSQILHDADGQKPAQQNPQHSTGKIVQGVVFENFPRGKAQGLLGADEDPLFPDDPGAGGKADYHGHQQEEQGHDIAQTIDGIHNVGDAPHIAHIFPAREDPVLHLKRLRLALDTGAQFLIAQLSPLLGQRLQAIQIGRLPFFIGVGEIVHPVQHIAVDIGGGVAVAVIVSVKGILWQTDIVFVGTQAHRAGATGIQQADCTEYRYIDDGSNLEGIPC